MPSSLLQCIREQQQRQQQRKRERPEPANDRRHIPAGSGERRGVAYAATLDAACIVPATTAAQQHDEPHREDQSSAAEHATHSNCDSGGSHDPDSRQSDWATAAAATQPQQFYGSPRHTAVELSIQRFLHGVKNRLLLGASPQRVFELQCLAFEYADAHMDQGLRIFAEEYSSKGARRFIASTYDHFWHYYRNIVPHKRHHYEIVREGSPCHLYFDLEYPKAVNRDACSDSLVDQLMTAVEEAVQRQFDIRCEAAAWIELDSSTDTKFSRHLLLRLPGAAFHSNRDAGAFVAQLLAAAPDTFMLAKDADGTQTCLVDTSVYSRNRAFRLFDSSKFGKEAILKRSGRLQTASLSQQETFKQALICNVPPDAQLLRCSDESLGRWNIVQQPQNRQISSVVASKARQSPSPYPDVDAFLASVCNMGGSQGHVRTWTVMDGVDDVILFSMANNRWCGNIERQHKSNGIFYVVDLAACEYRQRCFDPACRNYRSEAMPLPPHCVHSLRRGLSEQEGVLADGATDHASDVSAQLATADELEYDYRCLQALQYWENGAQSASQQLPSPSGAKR